MWTSRLNYLWTVDYHSIYTVGLSTHCTYVSIHINTPIHNVMLLHIAHSFVFRRYFFFSPILILTTDSPFGAHSNRNDSLTRNNLKAKQLWKSPVLSPGPCRGRNTLWGTLRGCLGFFLIKKGVIVKIYKLYTPDNVYNFECLNFHEHSFSLNQHIFDYCNRHQRHKKCFELEVAL